MDTAPTAVGKTVAIIGAGVSGLGWADVLGRLGWDVTVFDRADDVGGLWLHTYADVALQNTWLEYTIPNFPWPFTPQLQPRGSEVLAYMKAFAEARKMKLQLGTHVVSAVPSEGGGWTLTTRPVASQKESATTVRRFDKLVVASGFYGIDDKTPGSTLPGAASFRGRMVSEKGLDFDATFTPDTTVAVIGNGKSGLDTATGAFTRGARVTHIFRARRYMVPTHFFGGAVHYSYLLFQRFSTVMMPAWDHPEGQEQVLHKYAPAVVRSFWSFIEGRFRAEALNSVPEGPGRDRIAATLPPADQPLRFQMRSALPVCPDAYLQGLASGAIQTAEGSIDHLDRDGIVLTDGTRVAADIIVAAMGNGSPTFPYFPADVRAVLENMDEGGVQLYRHVISPTSPPDLAFAGFNHGFIHLASSTLAAIWASAVWRGELTLPSTAEMEATVGRVLEWKRANVLLEPSRNCGVNTRFQQYNDMMCLELRISRWRKLPNVASEIFGRYGGGDYDGVVDEFVANRLEAGPAPYSSLSYDM